MTDRDILLESLHHLLLRNYLRGFSGEIQIKHFQSFTGPHFTSFIFFPFFVETDQSIEDTAAYKNARTNLSARQHIGKDKIRTARHRTVGGENGKEEVKEEKEEEEEEEEEEDSFGEGTAIGEKVGQ